MQFKLLILSVACFAILIQQTHAGSIGSTALNAARDVASIGKKVVKAKGAAVVKAAADIASIISTSMGLKVRALGHASSSLAGAAGDGFIAVGDTIAKAGETIAAEKMGGSSPFDSARILVRTPVVKDVVEEVKVKTPTVVEEVVSEPCEEEVVQVPVESYPVGSVRVKVRPSIRPSPRFSFVTDKVSSIWTMLKNAAQAKVNGVGQIFNIGSRPSVRSPYVYEIVETPRLYQERRPVVETFRV